MHIIVIRKFKQGLKESKDTTSNEWTYDRDNGEESKFNQSYETRSNDRLSMELREESILTKFSISVILKQVYCVETCPLFDEKKSLRC